MPPDKRKPPGWVRGLSGSHVVADGLDTPRDTTSSPEKQTAHTEVADLNCFPVLSNNAAMNTALQDGLRDHRLESQIQLVREHWSSVRRLWLATSLPPEELLDGLPDDFWTGVGMPGLANIRPIGNDRFEFARDGLTALIIPTYDTIPGMLDANAERHVEHLVDLVAVDLNHPDRYWRRRGEVLLLGATFLEIAGETCAPITVFKTPMSWLLGAGAGVCILDWDWARDLLLDHELIAEDLELGDRLEDTLKPAIWIRRVAA